MALHWPTFFTRLGSAIVFAIIMMAGLLWNDYAFLALAALIQTLCLRDYFRLMKKVTPEAYWPKWIPLFIIIFSLILIASLEFLDLPIIPLALCIPIFIMLAGILSKKPALHAAFQTIGGICYIVLPMLLFVQLRTLSLAIPLALVLMIWMNDTMAYLVGSFIGKTPFSPISPKKTWEGTAGGAILTIAGSAIWGYYSAYYTMADWMALALVAAVAGTAGDLLESKLKRIANVKDSGTMMPGHGGALDRFDSLLVAIPFAYLYAYFFMPPLPLSVF